jgi:hypothetical protein
MLQKQFLINAEQNSTYTSHFTIGFARLSKTDNVEDAVSAGSGTLVTVGSLHGVLTAAHVVDALPKTGKVGVILSAENPAQFQKQVINMEHTEPPVVMRGKEFGPIGPDLAFLRLTDEALGWLKAKSSFYSLTKRRDDVLANKEASKSHTDTITGIIHELTKALPGRGSNERRVVFQCIFCGVRNSALRCLKTYGLYYYQLANEHEPSFKIPNSFEGTSGGAIWRFYVEQKDGKVQVIDRRLIAVPFHQSFTADGRREITCQSPKDIYGALVDQITARWPKETKSG